jgi:hypothetical protein
MASGKSLGVLTLDLAVRHSMFTQGLGKAEREMDKRAKSIEARAKKMGAALGIALVGAAGAVTVALKASINSMDELSKAAQRAQLPTEDFSRLAYAGNLADVQMETLVSTFGKLAKSQVAALDGTSDQAKAFSALGISIRDAEGQLRTGKDLLLDFADAFAANKDSPALMAAGLSIFGKSFQDLIPLIKDGSGAIREAMMESDKLGKTLSTEAGKAAEAFNDNLTRLQSVISGVTQSVSAGLLPELVKTTARLNQLAANGDLARNATTLLSTALKVGVGALEEYNNAVARTSIAIELMAKTSAAAWEVQKNLLTFGAADGTVTGGIRKQIAAYKDAQGQLDALIARQKTGASDALAKAGVDAGFDFIAQPLPKKTDTSAIDRYLSAIADKGGKASSAVRSVSKALKEHAELVPEINQAYLRHDEDTLRWADDLDTLRAQLSGPLAEAMLEHKRRVDELNAAYSEGKIATADYAEWQKLLADDLGRTKAAIEANADAMKESTRLLDGVRGQFHDFFGDIFSGTKSIENAFRDLFDGIAQMITTKIFEGWIDQLFGKPGTSGAGTSGGNFFASLFGALFGGANANGNAFQNGSVIPFANGGVVSAPQFFPMAGSRMGLMGEAGPEAIMPLARVNGKLGVRMTGGGGRPISITQVIQGSMTRQTGHQAAMEAGRAAQRALRRSG